MATPRELTVLCRREYPRLVRALDLYTGDRAVAEELAQEALLRAASNWGRVKDMRSPGGWLYRVAMNLAASNHRRRKLEQRALARLGPAETVSPESAVDPVEIVALRAALAELPDRQRSALVLRHFLDLSVDDAADALGISPGALRQLCFRGVETLRATLDIDLVASEPEIRYA